MNRRSFLKWLGAGTAAVVVAPAAIAKVAASASQTEKVWAPASIAEYSDYANFSSLSIANATDQLVSDAAKELAFRQSQSLEQLYTMALSTGTER